MKIKHIDTIQFQSVVRKKNQMKFDGKWMAPENIILSKVTPIQKDKYCMFPSICDS